MVDEETVTSGREGSKPGLDAHCHLWRYGDGHNRWIDANIDRPNMALMRRDFLLPELTHEMAACGMARALLVQAAPNEAETHALADMMREAEGEAASRLAGLVGFADLAAADAPAAIAALAGDPGCRGLRVWPLLDPSPDALRDKALGPALDAIEAADMAIEILLRPDQLPGLVALRQTRPGLRLAICHAAKPGLGRWTPGDDAFRNWAHALEALGAAGAWVKVSGMVTELGHDWAGDVISPYLTALEAAFGIDRMIWGSDWPVINRAGGYARWHAACAAWVAPRGEAATRALFGDAGRAFFCV